MPKSTLCMLLLHHRHRCTPSPVPRSRLKPPCLRARPPGTRHPRLFVFPSCCCCMSRANRHDGSASVNVASRYQSNEEGTHRHAPEPNNGQPLAPCIPSLRSAHLRPPAYISSTAVESFPRHTFGHTMVDTMARPLDGWIHEPAYGGARHVGAAGYYAADQTPLRLPPPSSLMSGAGSGSNTHASPARTSVPTTPSNTATPTARAHLPPLHTNVKPTYNYDYQTPSPSQRSSPPLPAPTIQPLHHVAALAHQRRSAVQDLARVSPTLSSSTSERSVEDYQDARALQGHVPATQGYISTSSRRPSDNKSNPHYHRDSHTITITSKHINNNNNNNNLFATTSDCLARTSITTLTCTPILDYTRPTPRVRARSRYRSPRAPRRA